MNYRSIVAPLLVSPQAQYSTVTFLNQNEYNSFYRRERVGCFKVDTVQESFLLYLKDQRFISLLQVDKLIDQSDDLQISLELKQKGVSMYGCNTNDFGYSPDKSMSSSVSDEQEDNFVLVRMEHLLNGPNKTFNRPLAVTKHIQPSAAKKRRTKLGFDQIYVINLERRPDRKSRIESALDDLNISFKTAKATDSRAITDAYLKSLNIQIIPNYKDPYNERPMNYGEIACFLSHYFIWQEVLLNAEKYYFINKRVSVSFGLGLDG